MHFATQQLALDDWSTRVIWRGSGEPTLVFLHSLGSNALVWTQVMDQLPPDVTSISIDIRGQGASESDYGPFTIAGLAGDAITLLRRLSVSNCALVGMSFGGMIAQKAATMPGSAIKRLVLFDTACFLDTSMRKAWCGRAAEALNGGMASLVEPTLTRWFPPGIRGLDEKTLREVGKAIEATDYRHYAAAARALAGVDLRDNARTITQPTHIVVGERDVALPPPCSHLLAELIPNATLTVLPGIGHCPPLEDAALVARLLTRFYSEGDAPIRDG